MIALLFNTYSASGKGKKIAQAILAYAQQQHLSIVAFENNWPSTLASYESIWLVGGDGTMNFFLNKYEGKNPAVYFFAGGTGNDIHYALYGKLSIDAQLQRHPQCKHSNIDIGHISYRDNDSIFEKKFLNGIGLGIDGEVLKKMKTIRYIGGHLGYLLTVVQKIFTYRESNYTIVHNNGSLMQKCSMLSIANCCRTGGGFMVSPLASPTDGQLNLVTCFFPTILKRLQLLPKVEKGKHLILPQVLHEKITSVNIVSTQLVYGQIDGELICGNHFDITLHPNKINFQLPA